jgi:RHS repeat-associated protein
VAYETDEAGNVTLMFSYDSAGLPLTMRYQGQTYYYHTNDRGDVLKITDGSGNVVASYRYDAWGNTLEATGQLAGVNPYRYAGYRYDEATGLYYLFTRYYAPKVGRFISRDTIQGAPKASETLNVYAYAHNNPMLYVDPDGRWVVIAGAAAVGAGYNVYTYHRNAKRYRFRTSTSGYIVAGTVGAANLAITAAGGAALKGASVAVKVTFAVVKATSNYISNTIATRGRLSLRGWFGSVASAARKSIFGR